CPQARSEGMSDDNQLSELRLKQPPSAVTANAIIDALGKFFITPSASNKLAAIAALQAYFTEIERRRGNDGIWS
ncbi:MAG TPA: hypothetical protein VHK70_00160, partial [Burkholderiaceae bacterium]|nr:hypothetical protein [Burkholderiaceae bacterium]